MSAIAAPPLPASKSPPQAADQRPWKWTRADLIRLHELGFFRGRRVMLIDGEVIAMSPMNEPHARGIVFAGEILQAMFGAAYTLRTQMPMDLGQNTDPEPDLAVIAGSSRSQPATPPTTAALIVEVAVTSLDYDTDDKASLYGAAGIADYWVLDVLNGRLHIFQNPRPDATQRFGYGYSQHTIHSPTERISPLAAASSSIAVSDLLP